MSDLVGVRVYWPRWNTPSHRETGIVRAVANDGSGWRLLVEEDDGDLYSINACDATTRGPEATP